MATSVERDPIGSISGFVIVLLVFVFGSFIPGPMWVRLAALAIATLLAVKGGISGLDVITLGFVVFMIGGSLVSGGFIAASEAPELKKLHEPIRVPAGYGFELDGLQRDFDHQYQSKPMPVRLANQAVADVVDYYIAGLAPEWRVIERKEVVGYADGLNAQAKFRQGHTSNGIGLTVYANVWGRSATVDLSIQALNCGDDVRGMPSGEVCWMGPA